MKKILSVLTVLAIVFAVSSCGNKKKKDNAAAVGTHVHDDGTVHADDAHSHDAPAQESFEVKDDTNTEHKHEHGDANAEGHEHEHGDESGHDHDHEHGEHK